MNESPATATSEALSLKSSIEVRQESHVQEAKHSEAPFSVENANVRIANYINNGLTSEQVDKRLDAELQQPEVQRQLLKEFSPFSQRVTPYIRTTQELSVYTRNGLQESTILDRPCLQLKIDPARTDAMGRSNLERAATGRAPIDENGDSVNLHHIGQKQNSPLAELPNRVHKECDALLHDKSIPTEVHGDGTNWNKEKSQYWQARAATM